MKTGQVIACVLLLLCIFASAYASSLEITRIPTYGTFASFDSNRESDGKGCAVCVFALTVVQNEIKKGAKDIAKLIAGMCKVFGNKTVIKICETLVIDFGPRFIEWLLKKENPDWICSKLKVCRQCHLVHGSEYYQLPKNARDALTTEFVEDLQMRARLFGGIIGSQITEATTFTAGWPNIPPKVDIDKDTYSSIHFCHRCADWQGRDCNDLIGGIHPGVKDETTADGNCNGIYGKEMGAAKTFEGEYCQSYDSDRQLVFFGDSATAGFSIPVHWLRFKNLTEIFNALVNELDWPMKAWTSGWDESAVSIYKLIKEQNRCAHRQFQNLGKNGAEMGQLVGQINQANLSPKDKPVLAFVAYIGNDVCKRALNDMTNPADYEKQLNAGLELLDSKVAPNSKVVLLGLADGEIIWDHLWNETHPFGITYERFYGFLKCVQANPCVTWLNSDKKVREAASQRAREFDEILIRTVKDKKYKNIELGYVDFTDLLNEAFVYLKEHGIPVHELIDDVDGFHPSIQYGHKLVSKFLFEHLEKEYPSFIGKPNPFNEKIQQQFGDQGGY